MARFRPGPGLDARIAARHAAPAARRIAEHLAARMRANAPDAAVWLSAADERVRPTHRDADGQTIPDNLRYVLDRPTAGAELARAPRDPDLSLENRINCFPGWVEVEAIGVRGSIRAWYDGPLVTLRTRSGRLLSCTPNHPLLTDRGWVPAGELKVGDDLVEASRSDLRQAGALPVEPDVEHGPAPFVEVHRALAELGYAQRVSGGSVDLYGDLIDGEVEVVRAHRQLLLDDESALAKSVGQPFLALPDEARPRPGAGRQGLRRGPFATDGCVRRLGPRLALLGSVVRHALLHGRSTPANLDSRSDQARSDGKSTHAQGSGDRELGLASPVPARDLVGVQLVSAVVTKGNPGGNEAATSHVAGAADGLGGIAYRPAQGVATDQLVHVHVNRWSGHVYTLSTDVGCYTVAGGIVAANCRCLAVALPGVIAERVGVGDVVVTRARARAVVSVTFPRIVESEYPDAGDSGGGWVRRSIAETAASDAARGR